MYICNSSSFAKAVVSEGGAMRAEGRLIRDAHTSASRLKDTAWNTKTGKRNWNKCHVFKLSKIK